MQGLRRVTERTCTEDILQGDRENMAMTLKMQLLVREKGQKINKTFDAHHG